MATDHIHQRARATMRIGRHTRFAARVEVTSTGLLAIGALVSSILLSTAVLVRVSVREGGKAKAIQR
jgi:anti-sigma-K factor RskA